MRASTFGCIIDSPWPSGISRSAKASSRYSGGTNCSRLTSNSSSSTSGSSTSQVRICCSIMLKRACSTFMGAMRGEEKGQIVSKAASAQPSIERAPIAQERCDRNHEQNERNRPDMGRNLGRAAAFEQDASHDAQKMRERQHLTEGLRPFVHVTKRKHKAGEQDRGQEEEERHLHRLHLTFRKGGEGETDGEIRRHVEREHRAKQRQASYHRNVKEERGGHEDHEHLHIAN